MEQFYFAFALGIGFAVLTAVSTAVMAVMAFFKVDRLIKQVIEVENNLIRGMEESQRGVQIDIEAVHRRIFDDKEAMERYITNVT